MSVKRKKESTLSDFFTKRSKVQQSTEITWTIRYDSVLEGHYKRQPDNDDGCVVRNSATKIAGFDLDSTLIETKSKSKFTTNANDWKFTSENVIKKLQSLSIENYAIVIFSNQGGISLNPKTTKRLNIFKQQVLQVCKNTDCKRIDIYTSTKKDNYRKPNTDMWNLAIEYLSPNEISKDESFFVGDAAGRKSDFSNSDIEFANNLHIKFYTPEEFFSSSN